MSQSPERRMRRSRPLENRMSRHNGIQLSNVAPQQVGLQVASPMNDTQLIALLAAQLGASRGFNTADDGGRAFASKLVEVACAIVEEAIFATPKLAESIRRRQQAQSNVLPSE